MTKLLDLKKALEGFDENLDVQFRFSVGSESCAEDGVGNIKVEQKTFILVTYYVPVRKAAVTDNFPRKQGR